MQKLKRLHFRVENRKAKADLETHRQETYSHKRRDLVKIPMIKNSSSMKANASITRRYQRPSTSVLDMSQRRKKGHFLLQHSYMSMDTAI